MKIASIQEERKVRSEHEAKVWEMKEEWFKEKKKCMEEVSVKFRKRTDKLKAEVQELEWTLALARQVWNEKEDLHWTERDLERELSFVKSLKNET